MEKKKIAVFFGERSFEHDISILTGLQAIDAVDAIKYDVFPVYIDINHNWWVGKKLLDKSIYPITGKEEKELYKVKLCVGDGKAYLEPITKKFFSKAKPIFFDFALLAFHGDFGETGAIQGLFEEAGIPYSGSRIMATSIFMNKVATKRICKAIGVPVLEDVLIERPKTDFYDIAEIAKTVKLKYPLCVKPCNLGSSIAVSKVKNEAELESALLQVFALDSQALVEPFVENLEEYNISVSYAFGEFRHSVIERPLKKGEGVLNFADKYMSGGKSGKLGMAGKLGGEVSHSAKLGSKMANAESQGMFSLSRVKNPPELTKEQANNIISWAKALFTEVNGKGAPRIDFLCNTKTGEMWLGEVNPIPGSFAFYLWDEAEPKVNFTKLLNALIDEGFKESEKGSKAYWTLNENRIFKK